MNKKEEILEELKVKRGNLQERAPENIVIQNIKLLGTIQLTEIESNKGQEGNKTAKLYLVEEYNKETDEIMLKYYADDEFIGIDNKGEFIPTGFAREKYESTDSIKEVLENLEEKEEVQKDTAEKEKTQKVYDLNELEEEKEQEKNKSKEEKSENKDENKKRKPSYVIETINPDTAKMDYWQTIRKAFGLPPQVATLAFAYPVSSEDKVDYANITVYMLDKDGNIIDGLDVDNYFEFDSSTGNNPMQDNVKRHEEDGNKGKTQLDEQYTMIRFKAKNGNNTYISLEQKNGFGDYNDINAGRKAVAGTQNVEKQLETDRVRVWDSERELLMRTNAGMFHINDMLEEAKIYEEHGDKEYLNAQNADGYSHTKVPCDKHIYVIIECLIKLKENDYIRNNFSDREIVNKLMDTIDKDKNITKDELIDKAESDIIGNKASEYDWKELATKWGYYRNGKPDEEKAKEIYTEYKYNNPHLSDEEVVQEVSDDLYEQIPGRNLNR